MRMPRYYVSNEGMGAYAIFHCDRCDREYRSQPNIASTVTEDVKRGAFGGLLRNVPLVGDNMAYNVEQDRYRTTMSAQELETAWADVQQYFRECPTCHQIVCIPDFDEQTGFCDEDSPRRQQIAEAQAEQAAGALKGFANAFGFSDAVKQAQAAEQAKQAQQTAAGGAAVGAAAGPACASCGTTLASGAKFCASCGTPVPQAKTCPSCGATSSGAFCANCGTKLS